MTGAPASAVPPPAPAPGGGALQPRERVRLRQAAEDFEAILLQHVLGAMRRTVLPGGLFPRTAARTLYDGLLDDLAARALSRGGGVGLARLLLRELERLAVGPSPSRSAEPRPILQERGEGGGAGER